MVGGPVEVDGGGVALGVAGVVQTETVARPAAGFVEVGHRRGRMQPVGDGLVADRVKRRQPLDVVAEVFGDLMELLVGQHGGGGEIVGQPEPGELAGLVTGEGAFVDQPVDERTVLQVGQLRGQLERILARRQVCSDFQRPGLRVEAVKDVAAQVDSLDPDVVHRGEPAASPRRVLRRTDDGFGTGPGERGGRNEGGYERKIKLHLIHE